MRILACSLMAAALLAQPAPCLSQVPVRLDVVMKPFQAMGEADPAYAQSLRNSLARAIEDKSDHRITSSGSAYYYLKGQVLSDEKRHIVTLQLFKAKTDRMIWAESYDYRRVSADTMANDVIEALHDVPKTDTWD